MKNVTIIIICLILNIPILTSQPVQIALLKYNGGGDWYGNPTSLPNLVKFCNDNLGTNINEDIATVEPSANDIFNYPFIHLTGHGNIVFSDFEAENLRKYLIAGGFIHADDNYGMDIFLRPQLKKIFPELELVELPFQHEIFNRKYSFPNGLPKVHEHDAKRPQAFAYFYNGRMVLLYTYEADLGDGWEDADVHKDSEFIRTKALQMGANIIHYIFIR